MATQGMTSGRLKWLLAISVVVNLFLIAAAIGAAMVVHHHMQDFRRPMAAEKMWHDATKDTTPEERKRVYLLIKAAALEGESDMAKARALRDQAAQVAAQQPYDAAQIAVLSEQARNAENDARGKIESALILNMKDLPVPERTFVMKTLMRPSMRFNRFMDKDDKGSPPPTADAPR